MHLSLKGNITVALFTASTECSYTCKCMTHPETRDQRNLKLSFRGELNSWVDLFYSVCLLVLETFVNPPVPGTDGGSEAIPFTASSYSQADDESPPPPPGTFIVKTLMGQ